MKKILLLLIIAGAAGYGLLSYHFILFDENLKILKKAEPTTANTFVDARGTKALEAAINPALVKAGIQDILKNLKKSQ